MKRLVIYFFYDKDGIVDDYVPYFLDGIRSHCEELCVVVNGSLQEQGREKIERKCNTLLIRENIGFDSWAYKHAIEHYGYENLKKYDEVILCNFTFYGPIYPFSEMFDEMSKRNVDFWGITKHPAIEASYAGIKIEEHIQSYFLVFRSSILKNDSFKKYWESLQPVTSYEEAVAFHELRATNYFEELGFKSSCYVNSEKYMSKLSKIPYFSYSKQQLLEDRNPILKRKIFQIAEGPHFCYPLEDTNQYELICLVKECTNYDSSLIVNCLKRTENIQNFKMVAPKKYYKYKFLSYIGWGILKKNRKKYERVFEEMKMIKNFFTDPKTLGFNFK
ncbi:MAG: rhamnan synthesis F family protein [Alphaproteobacteria bacterium]